MPNLSKTISVNGWQNVKTLLAANGFTGDRVFRLVIINNNAGLAYLHYSNSGTTAPSTATDGIPIATAGAPSSMYSDDNADLSVLWINTAAATNITFAVKGL